MKIESIRTLRGPNTFNHKPVLVATVDLEKLTEIGSHQIPGFTERLLTYLPGLIEHHCSPGHFGGFVERLNRGTYFGHIVEHIAIELSQLAGIGVSYGKTVYGGRLGLYKIAIVFRSEEGMKYLLQVAVDLAQAVADGETGFPVSAKIEEAKRLVRQFELGPSTRAILNAADRRGIPWLRLDNESLIQLGYGKNRRLIQATTTERTGNIGVMIAQDKDLTKRLLQAASIRVPEGIAVKTEDEAAAAFETLGGPVVLKPVDAHHGQGVCMNLNSAAEVRQAFKTASAFSRTAIVEEHLVGRDYRVLVVDGKMVAAAQREPAFVVGDGKHTVGELVQLENQSPLRGEGHEKPLTRIELDESSSICLAHQGHGLNTVPEEGARVYLKETANLSTGGIAIDVTDQVHPELQRLCERAARVVGLDVCGVDLIAPDISEPISRSAGVVEVNAGPGIRMHESPSQGQPRDAGGAILSSLFPAGGDGRIPIVAITGTNGKTTVTRLIADIIGRTGKTVGVTTTDGIFVGGEKVATGDTTGPASARSVLSDPAVESAVLETARGGIVRRGLGFDWCDVGIITNVRADHIGQDGIEGLPDVLNIKSLIAERVREGKTVVLNAEDKCLVEWASRHQEFLARRELVYFSLDSHHPVLRQHMLAGGRTFFLDAGWITEGEGNRTRRLIHSAEIPLTLGGTAQFQIANVLAAIAGCNAQDVPFETILTGLREFQPNENNRGRVNLFKVNEGFVILDYAHNPDAFESICTMAARWNKSKVTGVVGVPGDRSNEMIALAGAAAARGFDEIFIRDDLDLRGRRPGEAPEMLSQAIRKASPHIRCRVILDEVMAMRTALSQIHDQEVIAIFYDEYDLAARVLKEFEAQPLDTFENRHLFSPAQAPKFQHVVETGT